MDEEAIKLNRGDIYLSENYEESECPKEMHTGDYELFVPKSRFVKNSEDVKTYFEIGDKISGFCNGFFGRDDYLLKKCVYACKNYAVFEYEDETAVVLNYSDFNSVSNTISKDLMWNLIETWRVD